MRRLSIEPSIPSTLSHNLRGDFGSFLIAAQSQHVDSSSDSFRHCKSHYAHTPATASTMSELFDSYASDLDQLKQGIRQKLEQAKPQNGEAKKSTLRRAEMELEEADEVISQMDIEVQGFPQSVRSRYSVQIRGFKQEVQALTKEVRAGLSSSSGGSRGAYDPAYADDDADLEAADSATANRQRLLQGTASLEDGTRRLEESSRLALETEDLGADILRDLRSQREQIENSRDTLRQADQSIDRSSKTLSKMIRRAKQQKLVTVGIVVCLVLLILLILYNKLL
ncbi:t-SNARE VTI1 [Pseudozyma hubeiensis]|nr:t-SNARE VTI1 [Pseudozyma hubeiensis]